MTHNFLQACKELPSDTLEILGEIVTWITSPIGKIFVRWFEGSLALKVISIVLFFIFAVSILGWTIGRHFHWWDFSQWGVENGSSDIAENTRNMFWTFGLLFGSLFALVGFANSLHRTQQKDRDQEQKDQELLSLRRKTDAEIFTQAVEQIGSSKRRVRLGGLYSLEQLVRTATNRSPIDKEFILNILETLAAYVRDKATIPPDWKTQSDYNVKIDIQTALQIIARNFDSTLGLRPNMSSGGINLQKVFLPNITLAPKGDLSHVDISESILTNLHVQGFNLSHSKLTNTTMRSSVLVNSNLYNVIFMNSDLSESNLSSSVFHNCVISSTNFSGSKFIKSDFKSAFLNNVNFRKADLSGADFGDIVYSHNIDISGSNLHSSASIFEGISLERFREFIPPTATRTSLGFAWDMDDPPISSGNLTNATKNFIEATQTRLEAKPIAN